jgi:hypothetical protein
MNKARAVKSPQADEEQKPHLALVEAAEFGLAEVADAAQDNEPRGPVEAGPVDVVVYLDSLGVAALDGFSLVRIFRREWRARVAFFRSEEGGSLTLGEAIERATHQIDEQRAAELVEQLLTHSTETISFDDLNKLWMHSPEDGEFVWRQMKEEARREFMAGHLAATVFEPVEWMRSAWERAKFLGVRDSFIDEYQPEGGVEVALVDTMAQAYFLQLHWTGESVKRTRADPRRHSLEFTQSQRYKTESGKERMWDPGDWEIPYASELACQEQAVRMADHFSRLFQRTVRQLDAHRLSKAKQKRLAVPAAQRPAAELEMKKVKDRVERVEQARRQVNRGEGPPE